MDSTRIHHSLGQRLEQLNQEIRRGLAQVRRHRQELEDVERKASTGSPPHQASFADILRRSLVTPPSPGDGDSPAAGST